MVRNTIMRALDRATARLRALCLRSAREISSTLLLSFGALLLVLVVAAYSWTAWEQHRLGSEWQTQNAGAIAVPTSTHRADAGVTLLVIPKIKLEAAILDGTNSKSLLLAPGHMDDTPWPGDPGNAVVAAHRDSFFRHIHELEPGDDIYVRRGGREYDYTVTEKSIVSPDDIAVTYPTKDTRLTLVTCYPTYYIGPAPKRLIVVAKLRPSEEKAATLPAAQAQP